MAKPRAKNRGRYPSGRVHALPEAEQQRRAMSVGVEARMRVYGAPNVEVAKSHLFGTVIGRLRVQGVISSVQYEAAHIYAERRKGYLKRKTDTDPNPQSPGFAMVSRGLSCAPEEDPEVIAKKDRQHNDMMRFLADVDRFGETKILGLIELMDRACVMDREIAQTPANLGALRAGLNEVARLCRMER